MYRIIYETKRYFVIWWNWTAYFKFSLIHKILSQPKTWHILPNDTMRLIKVNIFEGIEWFFGLMLV